MATWQIATPIYMRDNNNSAILPYYIFTVTNGPTYSESPITTSATLTESLLSAVSPAILSPYLMDLYSTFLNVHGKRFAKPYTPAQLIKATKHVVQCEVAEEEMEWTLRVKQIEVKNGAFFLVWVAEGKTLQIQLAEEAITQVTVPSVTATESTPDNTLEELNVNELPLKEASTFRLSLPRDTGSDVQLQERRMVETARIQAKIAHYKAQKAIAMYVQKYGDLDDLFSDSSDEDLDSDD